MQKPSNSNQASRLKLDPTLCELCAETGATLDAVSSVASGVVTKTVQSVQSTIESVQWAESAPETGHVKSWDMDDVFDFADKKNEEFVTAQPTTVDPDRFVTRLSTASAVFSQCSVCGAGRMCLAWIL